MTRVGFADLAFQLADSRQLLGVVEMPLAVGSGYFPKEHAHDASGIIEIFCLIVFLGLCQPSLVDTEGIVDVVDT